MKKLLTALTIVSFTLCTTSYAQTADPKFEWAAKVATQQGPELQRLVRQLAESSAQDVLQVWSPKLQSNVSPEKLQQVTAQLNTELKLYFDDVTQVINGKVARVGNDALVPAYMDQFTLEELKQLAAFFDSPAIKKYQLAAPELGNLFIKQLIEASRADVLARGKKFDETALTIIGTTPARKTPSTGSSEKNKPAPKK